MWDECERFVESKARTNKLYCSDCEKKILIGEQVVFKLDTVQEKMKDVYCCNCKKEYEFEVFSDQQHTFDFDG